MMRPMPSVFGGAFAGLLGSRRIGFGMITVVSLWLRADSERISIILSSLFVIQAALFLFFAVQLLRGNRRS